MKELKVRVWDKEQKKMLEIGDEEGQACPNYYQNLYFTLVGEKDENGYDYQIDADIMFYSDVADKKKNDYCDGDIVRVNKFTFETSGTLPENLIVKFEHGMFQLYRGKECLMGLHLLYIEDGEIVGNIHENPELISK